MPSRLVAHRTSNAHTSNDVAFGLTVICSLILALAAVAGVVVVLILAGQYTARSSFLSW